MSNTQFYILLSMVYSSQAITPGWAVVLGVACLALALLAFWCEFWLERGRR